MKKSEVEKFADEGVPFRDIAAVIGKHLNVPVVSITRDEAQGHFGFLGTIAGLDIPSVLPGLGLETQQVLGWRPTQRGLIEDLEQGHYLQNPSA